MAKLGPTSRDRSVAKLAKVGIQGKTFQNSKP